MENRNRNTAYLLISAGVFILLGNWIGFFTIAALMIIWLAIDKLRNSKDKKGYVLLAIGLIMLLNEHLMAIIAIIAISLGYFFIKSKQLQRDPAHIQKHNILESIKWDQDPWVLKSMSMWYVIAEINMDISLAFIEEAETTVILQGVVGDVDIMIPEDLGVSIHATTLLGQIHAGQGTESGIMNKIVWSSANYDTSEHRLKLMISYVIGDIDIKVM